MQTVDLIIFLLKVPHFFVLFSFPCTNKKQKITFLALCLVLKYQHNHETISSTCYKTISAISAAVVVLAAALAAADNNDDTDANTLQTNIQDLYALSSQKVTHIFQPVLLQKCNTHR